jgi:hypothetical protein
LSQELEPNQALEIVVVVSDGLVATFWNMSVSRLLASVNLERPMESTITGNFATRREAELAVEHVVQEHGVPRTDVFIQPIGKDNSAGTHAAGADAKEAPEPEATKQLEGEIEVSVDLHSDDSETIVEALNSAGAKAVRVK